MLFLIILKSNRLRIESRPTIAQLNLRITRIGYSSKSLLSVNPLAQIANDFRYSSHQ